jgi:hypothetical protein
MTRRKTMRFPLEAPVAFWWLDTAGTRHEASGTSHDISESGAYILAGVLPPLGARIGIRVLLEEVPDEALVIRVLIEGHVLRIDGDDSGGHPIGFAVVSNDAFLREERQE